MTGTMIAQDFANIFKAFIGTNYLTVSYAFKETGLVLGLFGILFIVTATAHCCHLIVKCKKDVVHRILTDPDSVRGRVSPLLLEIPESELEQIITFGDIAGAVLGRVGSIVTVVGLFITQFGFCLGYFVFIADTIQKCADVLFPKNTTSPNVTDLWTPDVVGSEDNETHVVDYRLLLLIPLPFFLILSMLRRIREMGPISAIANILVAVGFVSITVVILTDFELGPDINWWYNITGFPVFFGQVTASYEGIGTIIPIESSMVGNRGLYPVLLYSAILLFTVVFCFMGIIGYLRFGAQVGQGLVWSLPSDNVFFLIINITICIAVLLTYPLQNFVTIQILEGVIWGKAILAEDEVPDGTNEERRPLLDSGIPDSNGHGGEVVTNGSVQQKKNDNVNGQSDTEVQVEQQSRIHFWKRALVRAAIVLVQCGLAMFLKDSYAFISALVGAIGCIPLQYILPCLIHLRLKGLSSYPLVIAKDVFLILFGFIVMFLGIYFSIVAIITDD